MCLIIFRVILVGHLWRWRTGIPVALVKSETGAKPMNKWLKFTFDWQDKQAGNTLFSLHELDLPYLCGGHSLSKPLGLDGFTNGFDGSLLLLKIRNSAVRGPPRGGE